ncbi:GMP synthase [Alcaligenes faecalis subsp. faecalis NCIB 8687]|nr:GMP synthase [Alcaligenes faecalis subsp. faecalis NCIB 8687]
MITWKASWPVQPLLDLLRHHVVQGELAGVTDPEAKRKIIGREFVEIFQEEAAKLSNARWLGQGKRQDMLPAAVLALAGKSCKAK